MTFQRFTFYSSRVAESRGGTDATPTRRSYDTTLRRKQADQTRAEILAAATRLFTDNGWAGTSMREIAREAGVAVETVYSSIGSKVAVLVAAMESAVAFEQPSVPFEQRPEIKALDEGDFEQRATTGAHIATLGIARTVGLHKALREGAYSDPALAEPYDDYLRWRRSLYQAVAEKVHGGPLPRIEGEGLWAMLSRDVYELLVEHSGWTLEEYEAWARSMIVLVLKPTAAP